MLSLFFWYVTITITGLLVFPLSYRLLPALTDRGYALSRILGLLLWVYLFWLLGSLGILNNDVGGSMVAFLLVVGVSGWALKRVNWVEIRSWITREHRMVITVELLFLVAYLGMAFIRSANPEIVGTEKPMELAFINAILRSPRMPPNDPWLSGYTISYYYFGYVLVAMLARLVSTPAGVAFNLGISLVFALSAAGSYSILYNLLCKRASSTASRRIFLNALLGPFFILIVSNLGGLLHIFRLLGVFWQVDGTGQPVSDVWTWLDMGRYAQPPPAEPFPHWWWWQASRILQDFDFNMVNKGDIINEFPFFSFLLSDLHPHVLAMPFAFLAISVALNQFLGGGRGQIRWLWMDFRIEPVVFILASVVLGSLGFFNTWDFPFYVTLFVGAYILREVFFEDEDSPLGSSPSLWQILGELMKLGFALGISGALLYLPFYFGFQSQAGGPLPNLIYVTRGVYLWIHFIPLLVPIFGLLTYLWKITGDRQRLANGVKLTLGLIVVLLGFTLLLSLLIANIHVLQIFNQQASVATNAFLGSMAAPGWKSLILEGFARRFAWPGTLLTLAAILSLAFALLWSRTHKRVDMPTTLAPPPLAPSHMFSLLLVLIGSLIVLAPEFVFLRDLFGYRINTIFKFYFQVWLMWGIAAAYSVILVWQELTFPWRSIFGISMGLILAASLTYPVMGLWSKTNGFQPYDGFTLDGTAYLNRSNPEEAAAMEWLRNAPLGVVAEAVGGSYTQYARMAANSGQPTVLGWDFHELQWRGGSKEMGSRRGDIERMYCTDNWDEAKQILNQYDINYVVVGSMENIAYGAGSDTCPGGFNEIKFSRRLSLVFQQGGTSIYQVPDEIDVP